MLLTVYRTLLLTLSIVYDDVHESATTKLMRCKVAAINSGKFGD